MNGIKETPTSLGSIYDSIKSSNTAVNSNPLLGSAPTGDALKFQLGKKCEQLKDNCYKHILLDVYCKILPFDKEFVDGHIGQMKGDIDAMLQNKGMSPAQYMTSCYNATKASVLEFVMRSVNNIGKAYMEENQKEIEDAQKDGMDVPMPDVPEDPTTDENINDQLVDVENDIDYNQFVDTLKKKTIDKIVADVSKIISDKDEDAEMSFDPKPIGEIQEELESTTSIGMNYLQYKLIREGVDVSGMTEELLGYAIREATINQFDMVFNQPGRSFKEFASRVRFGKGFIINESAVAAFVEAAKSVDDTKKIIDDANKERDERINSQLKASDVINSKKTDNEEAGNEK